MSFDNPSYPLDVKFSKENTNNILNEKLQSEINDLKSFIEKEITTLSELRNVLDESRNILNITKKDESNGFLSSLRFFSFKTSQTVSESISKPKDEIINDDSK